MNKSEDFNRFVQWVSFGGEGVLAENHRDEQRKLIKYNHLVANCLILHNVCAMTRALHKLTGEGFPLRAETLSRLSPYLTRHVNRFGEYRLDLNREPPPVDYHLPILVPRNIRGGYCANRSHNPIMAALGSGSLSWVARTAARS